MTPHATVIIGRNEGARLAICIKSAIHSGGPVVYVDSGSSDTSVQVASEAGCSVIALDPASPFTAARGRNEGFRYILEHHPKANYVQFVDGDCELNPAWIAAATAFMEIHPDTAAVCGRLRERHPRNSIYNLLCDIEWDRPPGITRSCGGIALMRVDAFRSVGGFRTDLIAGEEPELCVRLRKSGWVIWRLAADMALHDAAMARFNQWWLRSKRAGYAFAQGYALHGEPPERHYAKEVQRSLLWGVLVPALAFSGTAVSPWSLALLFAFPAQVIKIAFSSRLTGSTAWWSALFLVLAKFPEALGFISFHAKRILRKSGTLIEYK